MKVKQIYDIVNSVTSEVLGKEEIVNEDLSNIVTVGKEIVDSDNLDNYVKKLINHIGKVVFVSRLYKGSVPSVVMDSWEFGSILEKISGDLPIATESDSWKLEDGKDYSPNVFHKPSVTAKFFNNKVTFEIPISFTELQIKESFSNVNQLNGFLTMLEINVRNSMTLKLDSLVSRTINNMVAETLIDTFKKEDGSLDTSLTSTRGINLLSLYNKEFGKKLTKAQAIKDVDFIQFATYTISLYRDRISKFSTLFNVGQKERFTPDSELHLVLLSDFAKASDIYLNSGVYNKELVTLPTHEIVPFWQGSGTNYSFEDVSKINVKTATDETLEIDGILALMFDTNALGVSNLDMRVTTNYNAKGEFYNNFYKADAGYYNDLNENFIVFFIQ